MFVEGLRVDSKLAAQHTNIKILRKIFIAVTLIYVDDGCIQTCILMLLIVFATMLAVHSKPYEEKAENRMDIFNELIVYSTWICQGAMANRALSSTLMALFGELYNYICLGGLFGNFCFAAVQSYGNFIEYRIQAAKKAWYREQLKVIQAKLGVN